MKIFAMTCAIMALQGCTTLKQDNANGVKQIAIQEIKLYRDDYGTPHIFASSNKDLFIGYGYAVAQDRLFQMEMLKRTTQGKVAQVLGKTYIEFDRFTRSQFHPQAIREQISKLTPKQLDVLTGYAQGMNLWIDKIATDPHHLLPLEFTQYKTEPSSWTAYDVAMVFVGTMAMRYADFNTELENLATLQQLNQSQPSEQALKLFNALMWQCDDSAVTTVPLKTSRACIKGNQLPSDLNITAPVDLPQVSYIKPSCEIAFSDDSYEQWLQDFARTGLSGDIERTSASNIWLVGKDKLQDANGVMLNGPQFGWANPSYVYGVGLHGGDYDIVGSTLLATPNILFGHNNKIAWGATAGFADQVDVIQLKLIDNSPSALSYQYQGKTYQASTRQEVIKVAGQQDVTVTLFYTHLGAIESVEKNTRQLYVRRRAWQGFEVSSMLAWLDIGKQDNWQGFREQVSKIATNINFYYLDLKGNIGYTLGGKYPKRHPEQHLRLPMTDTTDWQGLAPFSDNAFVYRPNNGFVMNWNNRPERKVSSPDMWWKTWNRADHANEIHQRLANQQQWSVKQVWQLNEEMSFIDNNIRYLLPLLEQANVQQPFSQQGIKALALLQQWDKAWRDVDRDGYFDSPATIK